jgi:Protein kinase domain
MEVGTLVGAYRVLQKVGEGGMGGVWLVEHTVLGRRAAIKMLHPVYSARPEIVTRFFNEARAATAISDPGIVQIFDFGHHVDGAAYIVMEFLDGEPLDRRLARVGRLPVADALRLMRQVANSVGTAHARGIVHRDLKPENIFLVRDSEAAGGERAKIVDFGIAKLLGEQNIKTQTSTVIGTPTYMSPEQCRGVGQIDQRSDVYALGCVLFTLVVGRPPFDSEGAGEILAMHLREPAPAPSQRVPGIPPDVDGLVLRCMEKDPARRFSSGTELGTAITAVLTNVSSPGIALPLDARGPTAPTLALPATTLSSAASVSLAPARSSHRVWWLAVAGVVGLVVVVALLTTRGGGDASLSARPRESDPPPQLAAAMKGALTSFVAWSRTHAGAPCPAIETLGASVQDPWGHPMQLTCTDQPANQIVGVISAGPDGALGTSDDIASWQLGREISEIVAGRRWETTAPAVVAAAAPEPPPKQEAVANRADVKATEPTPSAVTLARVTAVDGKPADLRGTKSAETPAETRPAAPRPIETKPAEPKPVGTNSLGTQPAETKAVETKQLGTKPAEPKPVGTNSLGTKPVETRPVETNSLGTKSADARPVETKPAETKPVETKPADAASLKQETKPPQSETAAKPAPASPKPRDQRASVFWRNAQKAAEAGDCSTALSVAKRVEEIDAAYYRAVNTGEGAIARCAARDAQRTQDAGAAEAKRAKEAAAEAQQKPQQKPQPQPPSSEEQARRIEAYVTQCRTVAARNDCGAARAIAARIAEQYPAVYRDRIVTDPTIARCLTAN